MLWFFRCREMPDVHFPAASGLLPLCSPVSQNARPTMFHQYQKYCFPAHSLYVLSLFSSRSFCHKGYFMPQKQNVSTTKKPPATAHPPVHHSQTTFFYHYIVIFITVRKDKNIPSDFRLLHGLLLCLHGLPIQPGTVHDAYLLL